MSKDNIYGGLFALVLALVFLVDIAFAKVGSVKLSGNYDTFVLLWGLIAWCGAFAFGALAALILFDVLDFVLVKFSAAAAPFSVFGVRTLDVAILLSSFCLVIGYILLGCFILEFGSFLRDEANG